MVKMTLNDVAPGLTDEEILELQAAEELDPIYDEDSPEMTSEMLLQFRRTVSPDDDKQIISLPLSRDTLRTARAVSSGYTSFLSRLLDEAIKDDQLVRRCL